MDSTEDVSGNTKTTQGRIVLDAQPQQVKIILQSFVNFLQQANLKESRSVSVNGIPVMAIRPSNSSMASYMSYRKNVQDRMSEISNNVSQMIIESCTSIDNICNKVRECLTDMHFNTVKINSISEISQYGRMNKVQSNYDMDACMVSEKPYAKGSNEDNRKSQSEVSVIESVHDDVSKSLNRSDQITLTPFFTIIQEVVPATLQKTDSKRQMLKTKNKLSLAKLTRQMNKKSGILDAFKSALMSNADIDEYEVLDKVVEDMNEEIRRLSTTLLDMKKLTATKVIIDTKKVNNNNMSENEQRLAIPAVLASEEKAKEEPEKHVSSSFAAVPYVESNNSLTEAIPEAETTKLSESIAQLVPDVYRRPAVTDLHIKLLVQIEANDSYICFQRLMNRDLRGKLHRRKSQIRQLLMTEGQITRPRVVTGPPPLPTQKTVSNSSCISTKTAHSVNDLKKKYADSLWFSEKQILKKPHGKKVDKAKKHTRLASSQASIGNSVIKFVSKVKLSKTGLLLSDRSKTSVKRCHTAASKPRSVERAADLKKTNSLMSKSSLDPGIASKHQVRVINDAPASPSTKYKMQCMKARTMLSPNRHLGHLDILDDLTEKDLLPLQSEYPRRDNMTEKVESRDVEDTYLYKILHSKYNSKATWSHLIEPWVECSEEKCQVCSSANEKRGGNKPKTGVEELLPPVYDHRIMTKEQMVKKLLPYMIDPSNTAAAASNFRTVTVLPVQVVYDKHQVPVVNAEQPTKMASTKPAGAPTKLPLLPMKESRMYSVRGTWAAPTQQSPTQHHPRPMKVVYDGLPNKPLELLTPAPKPETPLDAMNMSISLTSKIYSNSARCNDEKKSLTGAHQKTSRSFSPRGFSNYCTAYDSSSAMKRNSSISGRNETKQKQEKSLTKVLQSKKLPYMPDRRHQRNFIYGKTVQQQLVSFVERQTEVYSVPRPKYAEPVIKNQAVVVAQPPPTNQNATNSVSIPVPTVTVPSPKNQLTPTPKNLPITHEDRPKSVPSLRHNLMLAQLRGLKDKNDTIQSNIQKAINVIETKMVHILSTPADSSSVEAFDDMEKEITNVLSMMKNQALGDAEKTSKKRKRGTGNNPDKIEEEFTTISDELFKKLDQILDSEISRCSSTTERTDRQEHVGTNNKKTNKNNLLSSSITTSVEEMTDGTRHMKPHKKSEKSRKFSAMSVKSSPKVEVTAGCSGDQQKEITSDFGTTVKQETPEENKKQSTSEDTNSNGDFVDGINANAIRDFENVDRSATTESNKDVLDSEPKTEDILSLNNAEMDLLASIDFPEVPTHIPEREQPKAETPKQIAEEILPEPETSKQIAENILLNLLDAPYIRDIPKVLYEISNATSHIPEHDDPKPVKREAAQEAETDKTQEEPKHVDQRNTISELEDQIEISVDPETITSALKTENENETLESFSDNVNKIIQRVEDIYSQLDDIQNADVSSIDEPKFFSPEELADVPRFKDESPSVPKIDSKEFLTPFMKGVKEKRTNLESPTNIERSPSLYNVLTFLDTLTSMKIDKTGEVHIARLVHYAIPLTEAEVWYFAYMHHICVLEPPPSCLRKNKNELKHSKQKKVSFLVRKENKESQVVMCPMHSKLKLLKVSSEQFPPLDRQTYDEKKEIPTVMKGEAQETDRNKDLKGPRPGAGHKDHKKPLKIEMQKVIKAEYEDTKCHHHQIKIPVFHDLENNDETAPYEEALDQCENEHLDETPSEVKVDPAISKSISIKSERETGVHGTKSVKEDEISECKTTTSEQKSTEMSLDDKSTQVYCHIEIPQKSMEEVIKLESSIDGEYTYNSNESTDQPKVKIYIDNSDISIPKIISITDGAYGKETLLKVQDSKCNLRPPSKVVVFREVIDTKGMLRPIQDLNKFKSYFVPKRNFLTLPSKTMVPTQAELRKIGEENKTLLKSFYAIVYIIIFTALNMEYRCA